MIKYGFFDFACPPLAGGEFVARCLARLGPCASGDATEPFVDEEGRDRLRVSLVRHPAAWLACYWRSGSRIDAIGRDGATLRDFMQSYSARRRGALGALLARYEADVVMRCEDQPAALIELLESCGVERARALAATQGIPLPEEPLVPADLRRLAVDAEAELCERYDYYA